jgi:hypothetical protein
MGLREQHTEKLDQNLKKKNFLVLGGLIDDSLINVGSLDNLTLCRNAKKL